MSKEVGQRVRGWRGAGWALLGVCAGIVVVWVWGCSFSVARGAVSVWDGQVEVVWGEESERRAFDAEEGHYLIRTNNPRPWPAWLVQTRDTTGSRDWRAFKSDVLLVRFPVWPLFAGTGACGCFLLWKTGRPWRGRRRFWTGVTCVALGAWLGGLWVWSGWGYPRVNLAPAQVSMMHGVAHIYVAWDGRLQRFRLLSFVDDMIEGRMVSVGTSGWWVLWRFDIKNGQVLLTLWPVSAALLGGGAVLMRRG